MECQKPVGLLKQIYYQGHGRYVNQLARLTIKFCKTHERSREMRKFIETELVDMARANPGTVIYVKPRLFKSPAIVGEFLNGQQHYLNLGRMSKDEICAWMRWYLTRSGEELYKMKSKVTTSVPSVQGAWTPFTFRSPDSILTKFPNEELGRYKSEFPPATEQLQKMANNSTKE